MPVLTFLLWPYQDRQTYSFFIHSSRLYYNLKFDFNLRKQNIKRPIFSVVKEEIIEDTAHLPCFNGRVVSWVSQHSFFVISKLFCKGKSILILSLIPHFYLFSNEVPVSLKLYLKYDLSSKIVQKTIL